MLFRSYLEVHDFIVPSTWPPSAENETRMGAYIAKRGMPALQQAVSAGQCDRADGLFYGGVRPAWSNGILRDVLARYGAARQRLAWIDVHTALGPRGHAEKIFAGPDDVAMRARAGAIWGADVTSFHDGTSTSARLTGLNFTAVLEERDLHAGPAEALRTVGAGNEIHQRRRIGATQQRDVAGKIFAGRTADMRMHMAFDDQSARLRRGEKLVARFRIGLRKGGDDVRSAHTCFPVNGIACSASATR